jgi:hypothetical protein
VADAELGVAVIPDLVGVSERSQTGTIPASIPSQRRIYNGGERAIILAVNYRLLLGIVLLSCASAQNQADCVHGKPVPLLAPAASQAHETFTLQKNGEGIEKWIMNPNVSVTITQTGCADAVAIYVFTVRGDAHAAQDRTYWYNRAARLLLDLPMVPDEVKTREAIAKAVGKLAGQKTNKIEISETDTVEVQFSPAEQANVIRIQYTVVL